MSGVFFLDIQIADLIYNRIIGACYGIKYVSLFKNKLFSILKCDRVIPEAHAALYLVSALY